MEEILNKINTAYIYLRDDLTDPRTKDMPLISSPFKVVFIVTAYLVFCTLLGPRLMKNRTAFEFRNIIKLYNILQILLSTFLAYEGFHYLFSKDYNIICDPITTTNDPRIYRTVTNGWWYFFAKITELLDTVFFVLRKKTRQISTLHLYHHTIVLVVAWAAIKYFPVGPIVLVGTLNSFIHIIMYSYYFVSALGPQYQKYLWWKKYLTVIQIVQFAIIIAHNTAALFHDCNYPKLLHIFLIANTAYIMYLFSKFYYLTYIKPKAKGTVKVNGKSKENKEYKTKRKTISVGQ